MSDGFASHDRVATLQSGAFGRRFFDSRNVLRAYACDENGRETAQDKRKEGEVEM